MSPILGIYASQISGHLFAPSGAYDSIATTTVGAGGTSTITFSSIPQTYTHLQVRILLQGTSTFNTPFLPLEINGNTGANYAWHRFWGDGSTVSVAASASANYIVLPRFVDAGTPSYTNMFGAMVIDFLDYTNTNKTKTVRAVGGYDANGSGQIGLNSGLFNNTSGITSITFGTSGLAQYSSFALYGIKGN